jgi:hypothetical protein
MRRNIDMSVGVCDTGVEDSRHCLKVPVTLNGGFGRRLFRLGGRALFLALGAVT